MASSATARPARRQGARTSTDFSNNQRVRRGYIDRHGVVVRFDDVGRAGEVITVATGAGATSIGGVGFNRRDREALEEKALRIAVGAARARASALAAGAGLTVDRIVKITEERAAMSAAGPDAGIRYATRESVMVEGGFGAGGDGRNRDSYARARDGDAQVAPASIARRSARPTSSSETPRRLPRRPGRSPRSRQRRSARS